MIHRELSKDERIEIRKLVISQCANYDREHGCLPMDCPCYMLHKWWTGAYCKYFRDALLPLNPHLRSALLDVVEQCEKRVCDVCGKSFYRTGKQKYCSPVCAADTNRKRSRQRMQKMRFS